MQIGCHKILDDVTLDNSFLGLNVNSNDLWSDFQKNFRPDWKFRTFSLLHTTTSTSFSIFELDVFSIVKFLDRYITE